MQSTHGPNDCPIDRIRLDSAATVWSDAAHLQGLLVEPAAEVDRWNCEAPDVQLGSWFGQLGGEGLGLLLRVPLLPLLATAADL